MFDLKIVLNIRKGKDTFWQGKNNTLEKYNIFNIETNS